MQKTKIIFLITAVVQPVFNQTDFLMVEGIDERFEDGIAGIRMSQGFHPDTYE